MASNDPFAYLWDGSEEGWILYPSQIADIPSIFNRITREFLLMEDEDEWRAVANRMLENGVPLLDAFPGKE
jgi:hypothetical protein